MNKTKITAEKDVQEFFIEREFDAPRDLVFRAFSEPELLVQWLGPDRLEMKIDKYGGMLRRTGNRRGWLHLSPNIWKSPRKSSARRRVPSCGAVGAGQGDRRA